MSEPFKIDRVAEAASIERNVAALTPDPDVSARVFRGARKLLSRPYLRDPNWVVAMKLYGTGSTYAFAICRRLGIDPESTSAAPSSPAQKD